MRLHRPVLAGLALGAVLPVTAASAATGVSAAGSAVSTATLATISVGAIEGLDLIEAQSLSIGSLASTAGSAKTPAVTFVPLTLNGVKTGAVTVTPANSPQTVGAITTGANPLVSATSPSATLKATGGASPSSSLTSSLGSAKLLGLPVAINGSLDAGSVTDASHAQAGKALTITDVSLPNLADLLAALGIDVTKLPADTLNALISELHMTLDAAAQEALDTANATIGTATQAVQDAQDDMGAATTAAQNAEAAFTSVLSGVSPELGGPFTIAAWEALTAEQQLVVTTLVSSIATAETAYEDAQEALGVAEDALAAALTALADAIAALADIVNGVLASVPLVKVGAAEVATKAAVGSAKEATVTGFVSGVEVLGSDVLADVTGSSKLDLAKLAGDTASQVNAALNTIGTALSTALSGATGATGLVVPAPKVELLKKTTATGTDGAFGTADATVSALSISLGSATVPAVYALENAPDLPGLAAVTGGFKTAPLAVNVGTLSESARYRPGSAAPAAPATPNTPATGSTPNLPTTGGPAGLAIVAVIGTALAVGARRRLRAE